ncbi:hypothetical protein EQZ23_06840 [Sphingomonas sp. UV9]|uniref:hypothetical protein n=1 Tax=Sphingomonas sp. UV9 TaxID=1851410 RepID=UPI000FFC1A0F|nr:hypothetical protein [Sphingomonas sp. UV9]RXD04852.1 hypothetical protein EQZ23_06840 [Sphingomonas sp. UV9]
MYEVHHKHRYDRKPIVTLNQRYHEALTTAAAIVLEPYEDSTVEQTLPAIEGCLNLFFDPMPFSTNPIVMTDLELGTRLIREKIKSIKGKLARKAVIGMGSTISFDDDRAKARQVDRLIAIGRMLIDGVPANARCHNPFVREGYVPQRSSAVKNASGRIVSDTGRLYSVSMPAYEINVSGDPHLAEKIDKAFKRYSDKRSVHFAWKAKQSLISRGREAFEASMRSLYEGAIKAGEECFGRVWLLPDKPTGAKELVKLAALTADFTPSFYGDYMDGIRKEMDPNGWGLKDYERECWAGNEEALNAPIFLNTYGRRLTIGTGTDEFRRVVRKAKIKCGDRYAWMHLGRHDVVVTALDEIEALELPEYLKEQLRDDLATYMGWRSGQDMLKIYGARHFAAREAATTMAWQDARPQSGAPTASFDIAPELSAAFAGR